MRRRGVLAAGVAVFAAGLSAGSCGIPILVYLGPPAEKTVQPSPAVVTVIHAKENRTDSFLGYEMYYKFYLPDATTFDGDKTAIRAATPTAVVATLANRGYRRVYRDDRDQPLIRVPSGPVRLTAFELLIEFPPNPVEVTTDATITGPQEVVPEPLVLLRDLGAEGLKSFRVQMIVAVPRDADLPEDVSPGPGTVWMGLVLLAYGVDFENGTFATLHSEALVIDQLLEIYHQ